MTALICWVIVMVIMAIIEVVILNLNYVWFAVAALLAAILALFQMPLWLQCLVFGVVSLVLLLFMKPILKRKLEEKRADLKKEEKANDSVSTSEESAKYEEISVCEPDGDKKE